jgi:hypothetical protein
VAVTLRTAERDENTCRKEFTRAEAVEMGRRLEVLEKPAAHARMMADKPSGNLPEGPPGQTRDKVAEAVGMSGKTYEKAKAVVEAAESEPAAFGDLLGELDAGVSVDADQSRRE